MDLCLSSLPAVFAVILVLYTILLRARLRARWRLRACLRACLRETPLREPRFSRSRVFYGKLVADGNPELVEGLANRRL